MAVSSHNTHSNLLNLPVKSSDNPLVSRFSIGSSSLMNGMGLDCDSAAKADPIEGSNSKFNSSTGMVNALVNENSAVNFNTTFNQSIHRARKDAKLLSSVDERMVGGSSTVQGLNPECKAGAVPATLNEIGGARSLSFRQ